MTADREAAAAEIQARINRANAAKLAKEMRDRDAARRNDQPNPSRWWNRK